ncbi:MAG TPA: glutathione S-transferase family protein [Alphaproteobacteria bacterium]|nr:glutathione S-transferase family protein [Alphaproteobacteria bacterium]
MTLTLYYHPLSCYCMKALIALYETETPFTPKMIDLGNAESRAELTDIWPIGKFPVLRDDSKDRTIPESSIIIEYLAEHYPGRTMLLSKDPDRARQIRTRDRFFDFYVMDQMSKIVTDKIRPAGMSDAYGVERARAMLATAYGVIEQEIDDRSWIMGDDFTMADCAAAPSLFFAGKVVPFGQHKNIAAYLDRLMNRPSFARVLEEAGPYLKMFPG